MPKKSVGYKDVVVGFRVTRSIRDLAVQVARGEGLGLSEWLGQLVINELKECGALPKILDFALAEAEENEREGSNRDN